MIVTDPHQPDNPIIFANQAFLAMTGYGWDEIVGHIMPLPAGAADRSRHRGGHPRRDPRPHRAGDRSPELPQGRLLLLECAVHLPSTR
ncbi:hypothetical protein [Dankookia sp. P2]|uniref:hypothetical protein n=1 Tax=Dankookia sp. P2 TaxID=3423955 RepID=UPI003D6725FC